MWLIFFFTFLSVFLIVIAVASLPVFTHRRARRSLGRLATDDLMAGKAEDSGTFAERVILPITDRIAERVGKGLSESGGAEVKIREKLNAAGVYGFSPQQFMALKLAIVGIVGLIYLFYAGALVVTAGKPSWIGFPLIALSYFLPDIWIKQVMDKRRIKIAKDVPDSIDNLAIAVEAGLAFDGAMARVAKSIGGPLGEEFGRTLNELQVGMSREEALANMCTRTKCAELQTFSSAVIQSEKYGISLATTLATMAEETRTKRYQMAEERAMKIPVKIVIPVLMCLLPALMIVVMGPAIIKVVAEMM